MTKIITAEIPEKEILIDNYYSVMRLYSALFLVFHLVCVFFFMLLAWTPLLVWLFLGIGNLWSMLIDVPLGIIQRKISPKIMFSVSNIMIIVVAFLFLYLLKTTDWLALENEGNIFQISKNFVSTGINFIILLLIGILYGTIKEINDIVSLSYCLNHHDPDEYDTALSRLNINLWVGIVIGLFVAIAVLSLQTRPNWVDMILFILVFLCICVWMYSRSYFDNSEEEFNLSTIKNLKVIDKIKNTDLVHGDYIKNVVSTVDFEKIKGGMNYIIMKPREISQGFDWADIKTKTLQEFQMIFTLCFQKNTFIPYILWATGIILIFGCWDTIVTTFFITYLDESLKSSGTKNIIQSGYFLIGILAIPAYLLQNFWINKSKMYGRYKIVTLGIFVSAIALFWLAIAWSYENLTGLIFVMIFGMMNSTGYAASYPISQSIFAEEYNVAYSKWSGSNVINADVSAAPLKIINNFANAIGLIFWWALITYVWFGGFFAVYGLLVLSWWALSILKKKQWNLEQTKE